MSKSKTRRTTSSYRNHLSMGVLTAVTLLCLALASTFIGIVASRNRLMALGAEQRQVEHQIALFQQEIDQLKTRINKRLTRGVVEERLTGARTLLRDVDKNTIIHLSASAPSPGSPPPSATTLLP